MEGILKPESFSQKVKAKFSSLSNPPAQLYYRGDLALLESPLIAIVGTRAPNVYTKTYTFQLAKRLTQMGAVVISGGALGVDILAHKGTEGRSVMVSPAGIDQYYPTSNKHEIEKIAQLGLLLTEYPLGFRPYRGSFLERNRLIIALSECVVIPQADCNSGSMYSAKLSQRLGKNLFVFAHRMGESLGTQSLIQDQKAIAITDLNLFVEQLASVLSLNEITPVADIEKDSFLKFCENAPLEIEVIERFGIERYTKEQLDGRIIVSPHGRVMLAR